MFRAARYPILALALWTVPAISETRFESLFSNADWKTERVIFDGGDIGCVARVESQDRTESMSVWRFEDGYQIQFFSEAWNLGESQTADINIKIDDHEGWNLINAELYKNSVFFRLPEGQVQGGAFVAELKSGKFLARQGAGAVGHRSYSLVGAAEAIDHLQNCRL